MNPHQHTYQQKIETLEHTISQLEGRIKILTDMQKWRRSQPPYEGSNTMPHTPKQYGQAIDLAIANLHATQPILTEINQWKPAHKLHPTEREQFFCILGALAYEQLSSNNKE